MNFMEKPIDVTADELDAACQERWDGTYKPEPEVNPLWNMPPGVSGLTSVAVEVLKGVEITLLNALKALHAIDGKGGDDGDLTYLPDARGRMEDIQNRAHKLVIIANILTERIGRL
jgi:hypothetical protein